MWSAVRRAGASASRRAASASTSTSSVPSRGCRLSPSPGLRRTTQRDVPDVARGFRLLPAAHAVHLGAAAAAVGVRAAAGVATNAVKLRAARGAYASIFSDRARTRFRRLVFGGDAAGSAARVALVASAGGTALYCLVEPVPVSGRARLLLFGLDDEMAMGDVAAAELFAARAGAFLPPGDARVRRVAAVMWQLVSRLEPSDAYASAGANDAYSTVGVTLVENSARRRDQVSAKDEREKETHPLLNGARRWTVHVVDDPSVDAYTCPGGHVFVHSGLLDLVGARDDSALAFVLAHEMGHALCRHGAEKATRRVLSSAADAAAWAVAVLAGADYFGGAFTAAALVGAESAITLAVTLPNSRDMEREADLVGVRLTARACFDPLGAARVFRKFSRVTGEKAPGAPGPEFPAAAGGGFSVGAPQLEAYLSTHPLDDERVRNVSALTSALERKTNADEREALCASFRKHVLARSGDAFVTGGFRLPRNASDGNRGAVAAPSDAWRARFIRDVAAKIAGSPRGVTGALGAASGRGATAGGKKKRVEELKAGFRFDRGGPVAVASGGLNRAWRGPVRRARETARLGAEEKASDGGSGAAAARRGAFSGGGDAEAGETVLAGGGRLDAGARRAVRGIASRTTRRWVEL